MTSERKDRLVGVVVSLPTFTDADHNVLLEPFRRHVRWLVGKGLRTGSAVLLGAAGLGEGYFLSDEEWFGTRYDEFGALFLRLRLDPALAVVNPEQPSWVGMGEGPTARLRLRLLGLDSGPSFPAQEPTPPTYQEAVRRGIESSGILEWVEWTPEVIGGPVS